MNKLSVSMSKTETAIGWLYWAIQIFAFPFILVFINQAMPTPLPDVALDFLLFGINFICVTVIFRRFLMESLKNFARQPFVTLRWAFIGLLLYFALSFATNTIIDYFKQDFVNENDVYIAYILQENYVLISISTILLAPVTEEIFYRGLFFLNIYNKNKVLAYIISATVFSLIHILGYISIYDPLSFLLAFVQYLPAGITLTWAYKKADNIFAPILIHIAINQIATTVTR